MIDTGAQDVVVAFGLPRSGSTWAFNVVRMLLARRGGVRSFFGVNLDAMPAEIRDLPLPLVIKTHNCRGFPQSLFETAMTIATVRDPRDAVASAMQMFGYDFERALRSVTSSGESLFSVRRRGAVLRYERFTERPVGAVRRIADVIGAPVARDVAVEIAAELSPARIRSRIAELQASGRLGSDAEPTSHDRETQWHPAHLKDGRVGKFADLLSAEQSAEVVRRNGELMRRFYPAAPGE